MPCPTTTSMGSADPRRSRLLKGYDPAQAVCSKVSNWKSMEEFHLLPGCSLPTTVSSDLLGKTSPSSEEAHELQSSKMTAPANYLLSFVIFKLFLKL